MKASATALLGARGEPGAHELEMIAVTRTSSASPDRRSLLKLIGIGAAGIAGTPLLSACTAAARPAGEPGDPSTPASLLPAPEPQVKPLLNPQKVSDALAKLDGMVQSAMASTGVPGIAVAVVYRDQSVYAKGFGVRAAGKTEQVDADTVFQLASVSKPLASTVAAGADGSYILSHLDQQPLDSFRASYNYSNFGYTAGAIRDLARWPRLQLANGSYEGKQIIEPEALGVTHVPHAVSGLPATPGARTRFYGLGWNVSYDDHARLLLGHSGAFNLGAATAVSMLPGEQLGIVVLTNGRPQGIPEAISAGFLDAAQNGAPTVDWLGFTARAFRQIDEAEKPKTDYSKAPEHTQPARTSTFYTGSYANSYYGALAVAEDGRGLALKMGPAAKATTFRLTHFDGDTFSFESIGENGNGLAGAIFTEGAGGTAASVRLDFYDQTGLGTFTRE